MSDRYAIQELTGTVSLGVLAENVVLALSRVLRSEPLSDPDLAALREGRETLSGLVSSTPRLTMSGGPHGMSQEAADRALSRAIRLQAPDESTRERLAQLISGLDRASDGVLNPGDDVALRSAQELFSLVGQLTLARTNELFEGSHREQLAWTDASTRSPF